MKKIIQPANVNQ